MLIELDVFGTLTAASLVLLAGRKLVASWRVLNTYSIPEPVVGGWQLQFCSGWPTSRSMSRSALTARLGHH